MAVNPITRAIRAVKTRWAFYKDAGDMLSRRAYVEDYLTNASLGNHPLPDAEMCRWLALRLGVATPLWSDYLKKRPKRPKAPTGPAEAAGCHTTRIDAPDTPVASSRP